MIVFTVASVSNPAVVSRGTPGNSREPEKKKKKHEDKHSGQKTKRKRTCPLTQLRGSRGRAASFVIYLFPLFFFPGVCECAPRVRVLVLFRGGTNHVAPRWKSRLRAPFASTVICKSRCSSLCVQWSEFCLFREVYLAPLPFSARRGFRRSHSALFVGHTVTPSSRPGFRSLFLD